MRKKLMEDDNFKGTWEEYREAQKKAYEKLMPSTVTLEVCENRDSFLSMDLGEDTAPPAPVELDKLASSWDLGGYVPYDYVVTPWTKLFAKQMKGLAMPTTFSSIYIAKSYIYYLTRMQFANYLYFLCDVGSKLAENDNIATDAAAYGIVRGNLLKNIANTAAAALKTGAFTETHYQNIVGKFEQDLSKLYNFHSSNTYWYFYNNYQFLWTWPAGASAYP